MCGNSPRKLVFLILLFSYAVSAIPARGQGTLGDAVFDVILTSSSELYTYRDIPIDWTMTGRAQALFNEGINNLVEDNPSVALSNFNAAIDEDRSFWEVYYYRGIAHRQLGNVDDARKDFRLLIDGNKERYYSNIELGKMALLANDFEESDRAYSKAIKATAMNAYAHYLKANNHFWRGQDRAAVNGYRECLRQDSSMMDARVRLAMLHSKKNSSDALPYLNAVLRQDSLHANALLFRGLVNLKSNRAIALRDLNNLLRTDPDVTIGRYLRGIIYSDQEDFDRAFADFHRLVEAMASDENEYRAEQTWLDKKIDIQNLGAYAVSRVYGYPDAEGTALKKAYCLLVSGKLEECIRIIDGLKIADTEPLCLYIKAVSMEHSQKHSQALDLYTRVLALDPDIVDAHKKRGIYYQELEKWDESIADFTTVLRLRPRTLIAIRARGVSYLNSERVAQAWADFDAYLKLDSTSNEVLAYRGVASVRQNDQLRGAADLARAGHVNAIDEPALCHAVDSVVSRGDTLNVIAALHGITRYAPGLTEVYIQKIKLLIAVGKWDHIDSEIDYAVQRCDADASPASYSYLLTVKAITRSRAKQYDEALSILSKAIDADKTNALAFLERGKLHAHTGKSAKAISDLNKAASLGRTDATVLLARVKGE